MIEPSLPLLPRGARVISRLLAVAEDGDLLVVFDASGPIYQCRRDDREGLRLAAGMFSLNSAFCDCANSVLVRQERPIADSRGRSFTPPIVRLRFPVLPSIETGFCGSYVQ